MKIETKYDVDQEVWFIEDNEIKKDRILKLEFTKDGSNESTFYYLKPSQHSLIWDRGVNERKCFATKEELINSL